MAIIIGITSSELQCNASEGHCTSRFTWSSVDPEEVRRQAIEYHGWVKVKPASGPARDFCPRHAFGAKTGTGSQVRVFQPFPS